ncbi:proliferation marker protein Ki-67 [Callospermophilus lateralis]|uniref:proliferation marker protein Ki-67 n=1 Tax=Callospermophilus lateralis TaxID=76772 RepID=UPI00403893A2
MRPAGRLVTIKRSGADGAHFPLSLSSCLFGRGTECDIRIQLPVVSKQHCKIEIKDQKAILCNFSSTNPAQVNGSAIQEPVPLKNGDIITIIDRSFRYEDESRQNGSKSTESPGRTREQGPARRASRAGSSADPDGKEQDSKAHSKIMERNAWEKPAEYAKEITGDSSALDGADPEPPSAQSSEHQGQDGRNAGDTSSGDFKAKPRVTLVSGHGTPRSVASAQCFDNSKRSESPFKKLYQSMKEELDANTPGQNVQCHRKSGAHSGGTAERESTGGLQREPQLVLSGQPRRKSGRSTPMKEDPFPEPETSQTEKGSDLEPVEAPKRLVGTSTPLSKMTREKAPVPCPQLPSFAQEHKNEDLRVTLSESAGVKAVDVAGAPGKLWIRNQAPVKAEGTANPNKKPENLSSRSRRSVPTNMEVLPTEIQSQPFLTQYLTQVEKKIQKDSFSKPEKLGTAAGQICSGLPGLSSVDISNFGDSINKSEDLPLKRRRVSFGGRLRPELFDENLPPNTPLKKGETPAKRKSLAAHSPAVLKKIIKEQPASPGTESSGVCWKVKAQSVSAGSPAASPRITAAGPGDQSRRSGKASAASGGNKSPQDTPKKVGRKSGQLSSKRTSISRSQHGILQMICSKRRSGASEANLIVAKSWADVVKLGAKQTQTKVVKHGPQRQVNRRQRRPNTPKKPTGPVHHQFSTGHANSPCTIIIGKAQIEKVTAPARPYRMLNNLVFSQKMDYNEDLSGLTEMFKTPVKETTRRTATSPSTLSSSEKSLGKKPQVTNSGGKPLPLTLEISGSNVLSSTQKTAEEPSETCFASPSLRRQSIRKDENTEKTPRNISKMTHVEMRTPEFSPEPQKTVSSANKLRRSVELRNAEVPRVESKTETGADGARALPGKRLRGTPREGQAGCREESAQSEGKGGRVTDGRRSRTGGLKGEPTASLTDPEKTLSGEPREDPSGSQRLPQTPECTKEEEATKLPCGTPLPSPATPTASGKRRRKRSLGKVDVREEASALRKCAHLPVEATHSQAAPGGDEESIGVWKGTPERKDSVVYGTGMKRGPRTPKKKTQPLEDLAGFKELFQTPKHIEESMAVDKKRLLAKFPEPGPVGTSTSTKTQVNTLQGRVDVKQECPAPERLRDTPREARHTGRASGAGGSAVRALEDSAQQALRPAANVKASRQQPGTPREKAQPLEDLAGFQELFQTPGRGEDLKTAGETTDVPCKSTGPEPRSTPTPSKRRPRTSLQKVEEKEELSVLSKLSQSPGRAMHTPTGPVQEEKGVKALGTPRQKLDLTDDLSGLKRQRRTPKEKAQPLEDLAGFQELFQTPGWHKDPKTPGETTDAPCKSAGSEGVRATGSRKRRSKAGVGKLEEQEELSQSPGRAMHTPVGPVQEEKGARALGTPRQKLDLTDDLSGLKRQRRTPKEKAQPLGDLAGFQELFQTPGWDKDPKTPGETTDAPCKSAGLELVSAPASTRRRSKTSVGKVEVKEETSVLRELTQMSQEVTQTPRGPGGDDKAIRALQEPAQQALCPAAKVTGSRLQPGAPREKAQPLEDLAGFQELFQTPGRGEDPKTAGETTDVPCKSTGPEPRSTPTPSKRRPRTSLQKVEEKEELSVLSKLSQSPGRAMHTPVGPVQEEKGARALGTPRQKLDLSDNLSGLKRQRRTPKEKAQPLEDLAGFQELFQTPGWHKDPKTPGERTDTPCKTTGSEGVRATASRRRRSKAGVGKLEEQEELSQSPGRAMHTPVGPVQEEKGARALGTPRQKLDLSDNLSGLKRQRRTPKEKAQPLEDLDGFQELFQTPGWDKDPKTPGETTDVLCKSTGLELVSAPASTRRRSKTSVGKVEVKQETSVLRELTQMSQEVTQTPRGPGGDDKAIRALEESAQQALRPVAKVTGSRLQPGAPREKAQPLEDLAGFQELFQTPGRGEDLKTAGETTDVPCKSTGPEPRSTPTPSKRRPRTSLQKVEEKEELSVLSKLSQSPGRAMHTPVGPVQEEKGARALGTPRQKLDLTDDLSGLKRQRRTPKEKAQPLEDLAGFQELFQTPGWHKDPKTPGETTDAPCKSAGSEGVRATGSRKRRSKAGVGKLEEQEELSQSPGRAMHTPVGPVQEEKGARALGTPRQKLDLTDDLSGLKRQRRTPKEKAQPLEDLDGFQELFQTPGWDKEQKTPGERTDTPCKSTEPEPRGTLTSSKRRPRTSLQKVEEKEDLSPVIKPKQILGDAAHTKAESTGDDKGVKMVKKPVKRKLDTTEKVTGSKRCRGAAEGEAQPPEDLAGSKDPIPAPGPSEEPTRDKKTTESPCRSPQPEPGHMPASTKGRPRTRLRTAEVKEEPPAARKPAQTSRATRHTRTRTVPGGEDQGSRASEGSAQHARAPAARATGIRWLRGAPEAQPLEDLAGSKEPIPAPGPTKGLAGGGKTMKIPCETPEAEPVAAPAPPKRQPRAGLRKAPVTEEISVQGEVAGTSGGPVHTHPEPKGDSNNIKVLKEPVKRKLDPAAGTSGSKRRRGAAEGEAQPPEDLAGSKDSIPASGPTEEPTRDEKTTESPCRSPQPEPGHMPASTKGRPRTRLRTAEVKEEPPAVRKPARTSRATRHTRTAPGGEDQGSRASEGSAQQAQAPAVRATGIRRLRGAAEAQALEDLAGSKELIQAPGPSEEPTRDEKTTESPCKSPQPEPGHTPASTKGQPRTRLRTAEVKEEPSAVRKPTGTSRATRHTRTAPGGEDQGSRASEGSAQQARAPAARATGIRRLRGAPQGQLLEALAGSKDPIPAPGSCEGSTRDEKTTETPCKSPQPEPGHMPASTKGQPRTRLRTAEVKEEPPAVRKPTGTSRATRHTRTAPGGEDQGSRASEGSAQQARAPAGRATGIRRLRGAAEGQALEDLTGSKEPIQAPGPSEGPQYDAHSPKSTPEQTAERAKPLLTSSRVLRAPKGKPVEDQEGKGHPTAPQSRSNMSLPTGKSGTDGLLSGVGVRCSETGLQDTVQAKAVHRKKRATPRERGRSPEPLIINKDLKILINRIEPVEDHNSSREAGKRKLKVEDSAPADKGILLRTRHQNTTEGEEPRPEITVSAEKMKIKRQGKKPMEPSQEVGLQSPGDGDEKAESRAKLRGKRACLRAGIRNQISQPHTAEEEVRERSVAVPMKNQEEKGATANSDFRCLRSRKPGMQPSLESESEQRVTRGAKRCAENLKDKDTVDTKKLRSRSHRHREDI